MSPNPINYERILDNAPATQDFITMLIADNEARDKECLEYIDQEEYSLVKLADEGKTYKDERKDWFQKRSEEQKCLLWEIPRELRGMRGTPATLIKAMKAYYAYHKYDIKKFREIARIEWEIEQCNRVIREINDEIQAAIGNIRCARKLIRANQEFVNCTIQTCCIHESLWAGDSESIVSAVESLFINSF